MIKLMQPRQDDWTREPLPKILCLGILLVSLAAPVPSLAAASEESKPGANSAQKAASRTQKLSPFAEVIHTLFAAHQFEQSEISPDGTKVSWVETLVGKDGAPSGNTAIYVQELRSAAAPRRITAGDGVTAWAEGNIAWSRDSKSLAILSDAALRGQQQLYLIDAGSGPAKKLTQLKGALSWPGFSPDGKTISFLFTENATRAAGPLVAETPVTGVVEDHITEQRLTLVDIATGKVRQISPTDMYVYEYDWSPDGKRFITTAAHGSGDDNWYLAELYTIDAKTGTTAPVYKPPQQVAYPRWSPAGDRVAFIAGLMSDEGQVGNDIYLLPASGGTPENLTKDRKSSPSWLAWAPDGKKILFSEYVEGESALSSLDVASLRTEQLWRGPEKISSGNLGMTLSVSKDATRVATVRQSFSAAPEVWAGSIGAWKKITTRNKDLKPAWGEAQSLHWSNGGFSIQGWLLYPRHFDPAKKYPMVVSVHGGPA
ncbi:MAG: S9 family peptidase, partial [Candidatus Acidiferrales bacterium]